MYTCSTIVFGSLNIIYVINGLDVHQFSDVFMQLLITESHSAYAQCTVTYLCSPNEVTRTNNYYHACMTALGVIHETIYMNCDTLALTKSQLTRVCSWGHVHLL